MNKNSLNSLKVSFTIFSYILFVNFLMINLFHIQHFEHEFFAAFKILKTNAAALSFYIVFYNLFVYTSQSSLTCHVRWCFNQVHLFLYECLLHYYYL